MAIDLEDLCNWKRVKDQKKYAETGQGEKEKVVTFLPVYNLKEFRGRFRQKR